MSHAQFTPPTAEAAADPKRWLALAILLLAAFMNLMDVTIVNVALPSMQANLGADSSQIEWVVAAYVLAFAFGLLPFGRLGDIVGRKGVFLVGVSLFTLGSFLCGIAPSIELLIGARVLQGLAGAIMAPQVLAIAQVTFPPSERGLAFSLFGLSSGLAAVAGPILGGLLIGGNFAGLDWRPIFLVNIPVGIVAVIASAMVVRRVPPHPGLSIDLFGVGLFGAAILLFVYPLVEGRSYGWPSWAFAMMAVSVLFMVLFVLWERWRDRAGRPQLLPMALLANRNFVVGIVATTLFASGIPGFFVTLAIFLQTGFGLTPLQSGLTGTPFSVGVLVASLASGRLGSRVLAWRFALGCLLLAFGMAYVRWTIGGVGDKVDPLAFLVPLGLSGFGLGIGIAALFQMILAGVPHKDAGSASGALQAFQQVGGALGVALIGEIFFTWLENARAWGATSMHAGFVGAIQASTIYVIVAFLLSGGMVLLMKRMPAPTASGAAPRPTADEPPVLVEL